jgi:ABC-type phosphate/phosphonate transport system substrate-binding protein
MVRYLFLASAGTALALALAITPTPAAPAGAAATSGTVRIGLVGTLFRDTPEPMVQMMIRPFKTLLESQTGVTGQIVASGDADTLGRQIKEDQVQLGVFHGVEFAWARAKFPELRPLLICVNEQRFLRALLVIRKDDPAASPADLYGKSIALPRLSREHCRLFLERRCAKGGCHVEKSFPELTAPTDVEDALDSVFEKQVSGAIVDAVALDGYAKRKPGRASKLRTLQQSEVFPCAVVAYNPGVLPDHLLERFRDGMIGARETVRGRQLLELCRITRFESVPPEYDQMLLDIAKAYPPPAAK